MKKSKIIICILVSAALIVAAIAVVFSVKNKNSQQNQPTVQASGIADLTQAPANEFTTDGPREASEPPRTTKERVSGISGVSYKQSTEAEKNVSGAC